MMYASGQGVPQDLAEAAKWYRKAATQGAPEAAYNLGVMYAEGQGVAQDLLEAFRLYRLAAEQGHADAQFNLGGMYATGRGASRDDVEAYKWIAMAAANGDQDAARAMDRLSGRMTVAQVADAKQRVAAWKPCKSMTECDVRLR